ncbi:aldo/keto reductase [Kitasatospora cystarginea]|uniref:aldo/keto reductase n=1 Tax=Kitasatospora cystarginea TaxID=58350 RepID=UPI0031CF7B26
MSPSTPPLHTVMSPGRIGIGCWPIGGPFESDGVPTGWSTASDEKALSGLRRAWELGVRLFDTSDLYGLGHSERLLGRLRAELGSEGEELQISVRIGRFRGTAPNAYQPTHMRHQMEQLAQNVGDDRIAIVSFDTLSFGPAREFLDDAIETMHSFRAAGWAGALGMCGPSPISRGPGCGDATWDAKFGQVFERLQPDVLFTEFSGLRPAVMIGDEDIFDFAARHGTAVLIHAPLAHGLLTGKYDPAAQTRFGSGDHRSAHPWFQQPALELVHGALAPLRERFGGDPRHLASVALRYCLQRSHGAGVLVGFTDLLQVESNLTSQDTQLTEAELELVSGVYARLRSSLAAGVGPVLGQR